MAVWAPLNSGDSILNSIIRYGVPRIRVRIRQFTKYSKLSLNVADLFNKEYVVYKGTAQDILSPGRVVNLSLKLSF
jgi:outer membrane receptor protein involved in Fe transport